jgi:hypothetical protein
MKMSALIVVVAICFSATAFAQSPPPKIGNKPLAQKPQVPMACKLVGTVKGTKLWPETVLTLLNLGAAAASETTPPSLPERARGAIPSSMKQ